MIWQLLRRDLAWKGMTATAAVMFGLMAAAATYLPSGHLSREAFRALFGGAVRFSMAYVVVLACMMQSQRTPYEAGLPIAGRDLWLAGVLSILSIIWLPMSIAIACGLPAPPLLEAGAVYTLLVLGAKCFRIRESAAPSWLQNAVVQAMLLGPFVPLLFIKQLKWLHGPALPPAGTVLAICGAASAALLGWGWVNVPKSLQLAPPELGLVISRASSEPSRRPWAPVLRSMYGQPMAFAAGFLLFNMVTGLPWAAAGVVGVTQIAIRGQCRWLLALPISPRKLFAWIALPQTLVIVAACLTATFLGAKPPLSPRTRAVDAALALAILYGLTFLSELPAWRRLGRLRAVRGGVPILWTPLAIGTLAPIALSDPDIIPRWAGALPGNWWQLATLLAIPVIASYWLAEKAFVEQEFRQRFIETRNIRRESI